MAYAERLQVKFERKPAGYLEDVAVITSHWTNNADAALTNTQRAAVETAFGTLWTTWKTMVHPYVELAEYRWYDQQVYPTLSPLLRATDIANVAGASGASSGMPPQVACSITLETDYRKRWGRMYLPITSSGVTATNGRLTSANVDTLAAAAKTFFDSATTGGAYPKVWSPKGGVGPPAFAAGDILSVRSIRVDDVLDIVRRRRWQAGPYRKILALA